MRRKWESAGGVKSSFNISPELRCIVLHVIPLVRELEANRPDNRITIATIRLHYAVGIQTRINDRSNQHPIAKTLAAQKRQRQFSLEASGYVTEAGVAAVTVQIVIGRAKSKISGNS